MSRPLQSGGGGRETEAFFGLWSVKGNGPPGAPAAKYIKVGLIKAITQSTCLIASIRVQIKKLPNMLLIAILIRMLG